MPELSVLQTVSTLREEIGGTSRSVAQLCDALAALGVSVSLVAQHPARAQRAPVLSVRPDVSVTLVPLRGGLGRLQFSSAFRSTIGRVMRERRCRLIHDNGVWLPSNAMAFEAARMFSVPLVITPHGMLEPWAMSHHAFRKRLAWLLYQRRIAQNAAVIRATAETELESIRRLGIRTPVAVIPNGIQMPAEDPQRADSRRDADGRRALLLSRIHEVKGILELLQVWAKLRPRDWTLSIVGPGEEPFLGKVRHTIASLDLARCVKLTGLVSDAEKWRHYAAAELFILPSFSENFGLAIGEALASGIPVITTTATPWHAIAERRCGWLVSMDKNLAPLESALSEATRRSAAELRELGRRGRQLIAERYSWASAASATRELYDWMLAGGKRPGFVDPG